MRIAAVLALAALVFMPVSGSPAGAQEAPTAGEIAPAAAQEALAAGDESTEPPLEEILARFFPGYVLVSMDDLDPAVGLLAAEDPAYADPGRSPSMIRADFNGDGIADYALLVREESAAEPDEIFAVLMGEGRGRYQRAVQAFFGAVLDGVYLGYAPAGAVLSPAPGSTIVREPVTLAHPAVKLIYLNSASNAFYWDAEAARLLSMPVAR